MSNPTASAAPTSYHCESADKDGVPCSREAAVTRKSIVVRGSFNFCAECAAKFDARQAQVAARSGARLPRGTVRVKF